MPCCSQPISNKHFCLPQFDTGICVIDRKQAVLSMQGESKPGQSNMEEAAVAY